MNGVVQRTDDRSLSQGRRSSPGGKSRSGIRRFWLLAAFAVWGAAPVAIAQDQLDVVATLPVVADLTRTVGGDRIKVSALTEPGQDPHFVQPRPTLMKRAREADVFIEVGLQLELWVDRVIRGAGNPKIQIGQPGRVICSQGIRTVEVPVVITRDFGDVHPYGNPHVWLDPLRAKKMASNISAGLARVDQAGAEAYRAGYEAFERKIDEKLFGRSLVEKLGSSKLTRLARQGRLDSYLERKELTSELGGWLARASALRGLKVVSYHRSWSYLAERFGFQVIAQVEERPGIPPTAKYRDSLVGQMLEIKVPLILVASHFDSDIADAIVAKSGAKVAVLPLEPMAVPGVNDYFSLIDYLLASILEKI